MNLPMKIEPSFKLMKRKRWTIVFFSLLIFIIGVQGFFINRLFSEVNELKTEEPILQPDIGTTPVPKYPSTPLGRDMFQGFSQDPFTRLEEIQKQMDAWMQRSGLGGGFGRFPNTIENFSFSSVSDFDVKEEDDKYIVSGKISGAKKSSIKVNIEGRQLSIKAETKKESSSKGESKGQGVYSSHSMFSSFIEKYLTLPGDVDQNGMKMDFKEDVLTLSIPKKAQGLQN
ncbi:MAG: Hsp20/alpha crystallin family protein [Magnetococcales bacterium]|nr:Hsp20/alpha crystallin family protein [Magnetococcales bacterium]